MESYHLTSAQDNFIGEFRQVGYLKFGEEASRIMQFWLWATISAVAAFVFYYLIREFGKMPLGFHIGVAEIVIGLIVVVATLVIHELIHALVMIRYGARPKFEMSQHNIVATITAQGYGFRRNTVILVALTPLIVLTCFALLGIWLFQGTYWVALFALIAVINAGSSISDFWLVRILLHYPSNTWTVDEKEGMQILLPVEQKETPI